MAPRPWGTIRKQPGSGKYSASYIGPDGARHFAPQTFAADKGNSKVGQKAARAWLDARKREIDAGTWVPPRLAAKQAAQVRTFGDYSEQWLEMRDLKPRTREHYRRILDRHILPRFADTRLPDIAPADVREWHASIKPERERNGKKPADVPTMRAHAYSLLRTIMNTAVEDELIASNPCKVRKAGGAKTVKDVKPASVAELEAITKAMPERLRLLVVLGAWCAMRSGELRALRRSDIDLEAGVVKIRRGVVRVNNVLSEDTPKTASSVRDVTIPPHLMGMVRDHLRDHTGPEPDALLFPGKDGGLLDTSALDWHWRKARKVAGREDLTVHGLRHTGAVLAAQSGATLAELMARLGHTTQAAALRYQHAAAERDRIIAARLSELAAPG